MQAFANRIILVILVITFTACGGQQKKPAPVEAKPSAEIKPAPKKPELTEEDDLQLLPSATAEQAAPQMEKLEHSSGKTVAASADTAAASAAAPKLDIPTEPNTWLVTAGPKDKSHPAFGEGDKRGFLVNGESGKGLVVERGETYTFKVRTGVQHDFYFSTSPKGWGAQVYGDGVEGQFTYKRDVTLTPGKTTPPVIYYGCRNHDSMGGKIVVVDDARQKAAEEAKLAEEHKKLLAERASLATKATVLPEKAKQKIAYVDMLLKFKGTGLTAAQKTAIDKGLSAAREAMTQGDNAAALAFATEASGVFSSKPAAGPTPEQLEEQKQEYIARLETLKAFIESHHASFDAALAGKQPGVKPVDYDRKQVDGQKEEAEKLATRKQYPEAIKVIAKAEREVTLALNQMLGSQTIVYELKFDTPKDEFEYEVKRYHSYLELIPVAIEVKKPKEGAIKLMEMFKEKAAFFEGKSHESAKAGRWEEALVVIRDATQEIRRGLMSLGVTM